MTEHYSCVFKATMFLVEVSLCSSICCCLYLPCGFPCVFLVSLRFPWRFSRFPCGFLFGFPVVSPWFPRGFLPPGALHRPLFAVAGWRLARSAGGAGQGGLHEAPGRQQPVGGRGLRSRGRGRPYGVVWRVWGGVGVGWGWGGGPYGGLVGCGVVGWWVDGWLNAIQFAAPKKPWLKLWTVAKFVHTT